MKRTFLLGSVAVIGLTLLGGTPIFAKGGGHGGGHAGHGGHGHASHGHAAHSHAAVHHGSHSHSHSHSHAHSHAQNHSHSQNHHVTNHAHSNNHHSGTNHSFAHHNWNHNGWGHYGWGRHGWGNPGWGFGYWGETGTGYVAPSSSNQYWNDLTTTVIPGTNEIVRRNYVTKVIEPVTPLLSPTALSETDPIPATQSVDGSAIAPPVVGSIVTTANPVVATAK